jgi:coiled-coil domain-containing protein 12
MSTHASLSAQASDRKARLAELKSLKRKQAEISQDTSDLSLNDSSTAITKPKSPTPPPIHLSGRNYDHSTKGPKLGFEENPLLAHETLEDRHALIAAETKALQEEEERKKDAPLDLFKLQPKKPNWDLKRDVAEKMKVLDGRTENAIARLVRERIAGAQNKAKAVESGTKEEDGEKVGIEGVSLVEGIHLREKEEEDEARREKEEIEGIR